MFQETIGYKLDAKVRASLESIVQYPSHMHADTIEMICVVDGTIGISDSAVNHKLSHGDVYIFNAKDPHKISAISENNIILTVQIDLNHYKKYFKKLDVTYFICDSFINRERLTEELRYLRFLMVKIYDHYNEQQKNEKEIEDLVKSLLSFLTDQFQYYTYSKKKDNSYDIVRRQEIRERDAEDNRIYDIIDYIYANFQRRITLEEIACREFLSIYHLSRYIKKACGLTFSELVSIARCEEAERLLGSTGKTIDEIALEVGFANRKHLCTQFKKWFQIPPSDYRRQISAKLSNSARIQYQTFDFEFATLILDIYRNGIA